MPKYTGKGRKLHTERFHAAGTNAVREAIAEGRKGFLHSMNYLRIVPKTNCLEHGRPDRCWVMIIKESRD